LKIAHLILCHAYPDQLKRLIGRLQHADAHFYIHLDKKTEIMEFQPLSELPNVYFIKNRVNVHWAGYSQVQSTINGFKEILESGITYDYTNLLSGQDYPVKSIEDIHDFLAANPGKAFMHTLSVYHEWQEAIPRLTKYYLADNAFPGKNTIERMMNSLLPKRRMPEKMEPVGRSTWFTVSAGCVQYIIDYLQENPSFARFFKMSWGADEIFFQTILYNSVFKNDMVNDNLRYIDWSAGGANPKLLTMADAVALKNSDKLFARKFNAAIDDKILDYLDSLASAR